MSSSEPSFGATKSHQTSSHSAKNPALMPKFEPFDPPQSGLTFDGSTPFPAPVPKLPSLAKQYEEPHARVVARRTLYPRSLHFSDPPKSRQMFEDPIPSPSPVPKLPSLAEKVEELSARIASLEKGLYNAYAWLEVMSKQREHLEQVHARFRALIDGEHGLLNMLNAMAEKNGRVNGKGKKTVDIADATGEEEQ
ncbi:hypothetical protein JMJ35_006439 [Cladonia borealis]|uniref:Uncharacterized protein n=1 Tax=Cladonia borealis TaxID=184061 RepID=A0AA39QX64_9LECA|nr:hypothetical protein JMJ35_006439 [Cladonia borealis]